MSRVIVIVHELKVSNALRPIRLSRVHTHLGAPPRHQHGYRVAPCGAELGRAPVIQINVAVESLRAYRVIFMIRVLCVMYALRQSPLDAATPTWARPLATKTERASYHVEENFALDR